MAGSVLETSVVPDLSSEAVWDQHFSQLGAKTKSVIEDTFNSSANEVEEDEEPCSACGGGLASYRDEGPAWAELQSSTLKFGWDDKASTRALLLKLLNIDTSLAARDGWYSGKVPTTAGTNNTNGSVPTAPRQEVTLTATPAFASGLTLLEPTCLVPDVKAANPDTSPGETLQPSIGKNEKNKDTLSKPKDNISTAESSPSRRNDVIASRKKAQEIIDAFPLLDFMKSPVLVYPPIKTSDHQ